MRLIVSPFYDAAINLALEEVYFKHSEADLCFVYRNNASVIVGKHQNIFKEVNLAYCINNNIAYHRRISGGGTVFHDLGNLNISLHNTRREEFKVNYQPLLDLITETVKHFDIELNQGDRNDLYVQDHKVTGTACHVVRDRTIHHGTLLYNANKELLHECLHQPLKISGRGVDSVRSNITNLKEHLSKPLSEEEFFSQFIVHLSDILDAYIDYPTDQELETAIQLRDNKYTLDSWNLDYSPSFKAEIEIDGKDCIVDVDKGKVIRIDDEEVAKKLTGIDFKQFLLTYEK
ncbi:biotin/lipoate A/B protein ligase family protein [Saccharicrinis sp. FJH2]|uniref:lipoate--protein ligase family protein n=1 Tax=Saccharicrinis sp. FJH65 TaxID=3344659 RepID=UPI0035F2D7CB